MAATPETLRILRGMRIAIGATVDAETRALVRAWATGWDELSRQWSAIVDQLAAAAAAGEMPTQTQLRRAERVVAALDATQAKLLDLADGTNIRITGKLPDIASEAAQWQARLIASQMPREAGTTSELVARFGRVDPGALDAIVQRFTQLSTVLTGTIPADAMATIYSTIFSGIATGTNPRTMAREMMRRLEGGFNLGLNRALTIARTEMLDAHREAGRAQQAANRDVLAGWQWIAALDLRTCPSCLGMHGQRFPAEVAGPWDHQNGRCARLPVTRTWRELGFDLDEPPSVLPDAEAWFNGLPEASQQQIMGPGRLALWNDGGLAWTDLATRKDNPGWRPSYVPTPVSVLAQAAQLRPAAAAR